MKKTISDKKNSNNFIVKKNDIIFSCFISEDLKNSTFSTFSTFSRRILQSYPDDNLNKDILSSYYLFFVLNKKDIDGLSEVIFEEVEYLKKRIIINTALNIYSKTKINNNQIKNTIRPDNYFSFEEYVLIDLIKSYTKSEQNEIHIFEPIAHNNTFCEFLDWAYANRISLKINDIFNLYNEGVFNTYTGVVNEKINKSFSFLNENGFKNENGEIFFTYKILKNEIPFFKIIDTYCKLLKVDWYIFFQTLQKLQQKGVLETKNSAIIPKEAITIFPDNVIKDFYNYIDEFTFKSLSKLIRNIIKQKKVFCKICGNSISFSNDFLFCDQCGIKYKKNAYGAKISNWQAVSGFFSGQILYFSRKFNNYMVLYEKQTSVNFFEFQNKDR